MLSTTTSDDAGDDKNKAVPPAQQDRDATDEHRYKRVTHMYVCKSNVRVCD